MQTKKFHVIQLQQAHAVVECLAEFLSGFARRHFGLYDDLFAIKFWQDPAQLELGSSIATRCFNMVDTQLDRSSDRGLQIGLTLVRNAFCLLIFPRMLVSHSTTRKDGHLQFGSTKSAVNHDLSVHFG